MPLQPLPLNNILNFQVPPAHTKHDFHNRDRCIKSCVIFIFVLISQVSASILVSARKFNLPGFFVIPTWSAWDWIPLWAFAYCYLFVLYLLWIEKHVRKTVVVCFLVISCCTVIVPYVLEMTITWNRFTLIWIQLSLVTLYILISFLQFFWKIVPRLRFPIF